MQKTGHINIRANIGAFAIFALRKLDNPKVFAYERGQTILNFYMPQ
jgi:hypothetical protein